MGASETIAVALGVAYWSCIMFLCGRFYQKHVDKFALPTKELT